MYCDENIDRFGGHTINRKANRCAERELRRGILHPLSHARAGIAESSLAKIAANRWYEAWYETFLL
jgi:hypothetical protein